MFEKENGSQNNILADKDREIGELREEIERLKNENEEKIVKLAETAILLKKYEELENETRKEAEKNEQIKRTEAEEIAEIRKEEEKRAQIAALIEEERLSEYRARMKESLERKSGRYVDANPVNTGYVRYPWGEDAKIPADHGPDKIWTEEATKKYWDSKNEE